MEVESLPHFEDSYAEANWNFLKSTLPFMNEIYGEDSRMQFRVEAFFLLFNFITQNKLAKESPAKPTNKVKSEKDTVERTDKILFFLGIAIIFIFHIRFLI